ncbi:MAG: hypothetical protein KF752_09505 [Pirellulaceae bacterium]|nr:hypothetical protein [Pirellulaceae bacterium]
MRHGFSAMRVSFCWLGMRKSLSGDQLQLAAQPFGAQQNFISAGKKLIDTGHPAMRAVNQIRRQVVQLWKNSSLPFPEPGIRLVRQQHVAELSQSMQTLAEQLQQAVRELEGCYAEIKQQAQQRLGELYCDSDYPASLNEAFGFVWEFPNVEPPDYLRQLQPEIYQQECERVRVRFEQAVELAERAFTEELSGLVSHLIERLAGSDDGKPKVFRDSSLSNLREFFERFRLLNISSSQELDQLIGRAQQVVAGIQPDSLRTSQPLRQQVASELSSVQSVLDGLMVDRPRRRILRDVGQ